jgi:hypothetical protein
MTADMPFPEFPKITRFWEQDIVVTEKIDGTNGLIQFDNGVMRVGSRSRWIVPGDDNYGFAKWAYENEDALRDLLGEGQHYGEWWGQGIQRRYDMDRKVFSLFNTGRWGGLFGAAPGQMICDSVPVLFTGNAADFFKWAQAIPVKSMAAEKYGKDYPRAEGYMMYFTKHGHYMKVPVDK